MKFFFFFLSSQIKGPSWEVETGRKDGRVSDETEAIHDLASPYSNITQLIGAFRGVGLSIKDLAVLSGTITLGICLQHYSYVR